MSSAITQVKADLTMRRSNLSALLDGAGVNVDKFVSVAVTAIASSRDAAKLCDPRARQSLILAVNACARDGLLPDSKEAALVAYESRKNNTISVQYIPMVKGLRKLVYETTGYIVESEVVYAQDRFEWQCGDEPRITHTPNLVPKGENPIIGAYAIARRENGTVAARAVMGIVEIERVRSASRAGGGPWSEWYEEMCKKTVVRRLVKSLPTRADAPDRPGVESDVAQVEEDFEVVAEVVEEPAPKRDNSRLAARVAEEEAR